MSYAIVGHCPRCGAPIWAPMWWSVTPPPSRYTCACFPQPSISAGTTVDPPEAVAHPPEAITLETAGVAVRKRIGSKR